MKLATPTLAVTVNAMAAEAVTLMVEDGRGAVAVTDGERLVGIFTERDLMEKVVRKNLDPATTPIKDVMCSKPLCVKSGANRSDALAIMLREHFRHLPICDEENRPIAMLSSRDLLAHQIGRMRGELDSLEAYLLADGPGG